VKRKAPGISEQLNLFSSRNLTLPRK